MNRLGGVRVVLVRPENGANVGAVCRAMKNMGVTGLTIVGAGTYDLEKIRILAVHSYDVFENCAFSDDLAAVLADYPMSAGITRRRGKFRKYAWYEPSALADLVFGRTNPALALVFGNERTGLTDEELSCCTAAVSIPADPAFPSLNLSHAVQVVLYELYKAAAAAEGNHASFDGAGSIAQGEAARLAERVASELARVGFFTCAGREEMTIFFRDIFARAGLSGREAERVGLIFKKIADLKLHRR